MSEKLKVLLIAEQANPEWVSVPLVGWMQVQALQKVCDVHVVTHIRNKEAIDRTDFPLDRVTYISPGITQTFLNWASKLVSEKGGWTTRNALKVPMYYEFEWITWKLFRASLQSGGFDLVHRITPLSPALPSFIVSRLKKIPIPFVLGPINGGLKWPKGFSHIQRQEREWLSSVRKLKDYLPYMRGMKRNAQAIIVGSKAAYDEIAIEYRPKCFYIPENGIQTKDYIESVRYTAEGPLRVAFVGRLVPLKSADIVIRGCAPSILQGKTQLHIYGDGPERDHLEKLAQDLTRGQGITFHGWVAHAKLRAELIQNQVFAFPSIKEFGGGAVIEAMGLGLVPIVTNYGGIAEVVTPDCGFHIPLGDGTAMTEVLQKTLEQLVQDRALIASLGTKARQRILSKYTWEYKAQQILEVYTWVTKSDLARPPYDPPEVPFRSAG